ncbi:helix-turn-helix domain-containing protein [Streptomyces noursei]|uniref:helix-turn-helix domain-containing protein n=1 Tax=Streptomyces noursei TaxID=1971 RepID=UPI001993DB26|nr:hypothetical protein GCM10010341_87410 [Streptomyces noursei]
MRYAQGGGLTPGEQEKREGLRLEAAERFASGEKSEVIAKELRVSSRSVRRWRHAWQQGGVQAPAFEGAGVRRVAQCTAMGLAGTGVEARAAGARVER